MISFGCVHCAWLAKMFEKTVELLPESYTARAALGISLHKAGEHHRALEEMNLALKDDPNNAAVLHNRGLMLMNAFRKFEDALADFTKCVDLAPEGVVYV